MKTTSFAALLLALVPTAFAQPPTQQDWDSLDKQLEQAYLKGDLAESLRLAKLSVAAASNSKQSGRSLDRLGYLYYVSGNLKDGEALLRKGIEIRRTQIGPDTEEYAESANDLALFCRDTRKLDEARTLAEQAVEIRTRVLGPKDPLLAETMETLGSIYSARGEYEQSASTFDKARAIYESQLDPKNPKAEYGTLLVNIGGNDQRLGKYQKAEADFETALQVLSKNPGLNHPIYATSLMGPALLETELGHYALAEKYYDQSAELLKKELGDQHPMYVQVLDHRATLFQSMGNFAAAEADYSAALAARRKIFGPNHVLVAATLRNYGRLVYARNRAEGEKLLQESVDIYSKSSDHPPFDFASVLLSLGEAQKNRGDLADARKTFQQALDVTSQGLGEKHPLYASVLNDLAIVHQDAREFPQAERRFEQAIGIVTETQGPNHPDLASYVQNLAALYDQEGNYRAAEPLYRRSFEINDAVFTGILNIGAESNKLAEISNLADPIPALLSFQERAARQVPEARALAFEAVARRKGRVLDAKDDRPITAPSPAAWSRSWIGPPIAPSGKDTSTNSKIYSRGWTNEQARHGNPLRRCRTGDPLPAGKDLARAHATALIEEWLMKSDFKPVMDHRFNVRKTPAWHGLLSIVRSVAVEPHKTLSYTLGSLWSRSVVTWTLTPTRREPCCAWSSRASGRIKRQAYHNGARYGWQQYVAALEQVLARTD